MQALLPWLWIALAVTVALLLGACDASAQDDA